MTKNNRANFGSKLGVILASAGSAVGLGNIWRFPFETGNHGGAAFILSDDTHGPIRLAPIRS